MNIKKDTKRFNKRILSLFSGCGGMDIGFEGDFRCFAKSINEKIHPAWIEKREGDFIKLTKTGFEIVFANDIREDAKRAWLNYNKDKKSNEIYHVESIVNLVKKAKNGEKVFPKNIDVVIGGFPCQDFSIAGKRKGLKSDKSHDGSRIKIDEPSIQNRGQLYIWMREVIQIVQPFIFIAENVKGLLSLKDTKEIIEKDFSTISKDGYLIVPARSIQAADYGVPQSRERIIFYGFNKSKLNKEAIKHLEQLDIDDKYDPYPKATHNYSNRLSDLKSFVRTKDVLNDLLEPDISLDRSQQKYSKAKYNPKGQGNIEINPNSVAPTIRAEHHGNIEFRRLSKENGGKNIKELEKGLLQRRLSVRECARLQTFPDNYEFILDKEETKIALSASNAYKLIGNAVPPLLSYNIAMRIKENWDLYFSN